MSRKLIDRDALIAKAKQEQQFYKDEYDAMECGYLDEERAIVKEAYSTMTDCVSLISNAPTVDAVEVVHGRDIYQEAKGHCEFKCSVCGAEIGVVEGGDLDGGKFNYCPNCGAKMDGEVNENGN